VEHGWLGGMRGLLVISLGLMMSSRGYPAVLDRPRGIFISSMPVVSQIA
jgi:hypothetical protein